jgi:hypothetical protein
VGASQSTDSLFGVLLIGYLFLAVWTLSVFSLLQGQQQFDRAQQVAESTELGDAPSAASIKDGISGNGAESVWGELWRRPSRAIGNVQRDPSASWINLRFLGGVLGTATVAFLLALMFFFLIPRHPSIWKKGASPSESGGGGKVVGFSRQLALGDIGQILESRRKVMEVRLTDFQTGEPMNIERYALDLGFEEPLFKGMTAIKYQDGRWQTWEAGDQASGSERYLPGMGSPRGSLVNQQIRLEPIDSQLLFAMPPAIYGAMDNSNDPIAVERLNDILKRPESPVMGDSVFYSILSPKSLNQPGRLPVSPIQARYVRNRMQFFLGVPRGLENLRELAVEKAGVAESPRPDNLEIARRLVSYLKDSGEFQYTLNADVADKDIDPLEDFLFNRKMGHCEYFASALTIMLRSVGIPARLASGFKGGDYNHSTGMFEVEERHAHAWVEAYIDDTWVILDPTPAGRAESVESVGDTGSGWNDALNNMRDFWIRFIVNLNGGEQRRLLEPVKLLVGSVVAWVRDGRGHLSHFVDGLRQQLRSPERWISWQGGLVTFLLLTFLSGVAWLAYVAWGLIQRFRSRYFDPRGLARTVAFYERFRQICSQAGFSRKSSQTPREFGVEIGHEFRNLLPASEWETFPLSLIDAYYDVRYGGRNLSPEILEQLGIQLARFESLLAQPANS